jgi:transcription initiation factor IIF auxiliary subunit
VAIKLGWSPLLDEWFGFGGGSENSPFEIDQYWIEVVFMVKIYFLYKKKKKRYKYEDELGSKKIATIPRQQRQKCLLVFLNAYRNNPQVHEITVVAFHPEVFRVSYFHQERMCKGLLASLPKITRRKIAQVVRFSKDRDPMLI